MVVRKPTSQKCEKKSENLIEQGEVYGFEGSQYGDGSNPEPNQPITEESKENLMDEVEVYGFEGSQYVDGNNPEPNQPITESIKELKEKDVVYGFSEEFVDTENGEFKQIAPSEQQGEQIRKNRLKEIAGPQPFGTRQEAKEIKEKMLQEIAVPQPVGKNPRKAPKGERGRGH